MTIKKGKLILSAIGPPTPQIVWTKDGDLFDDREQDSGTSRLVVHVHSINDTGTFTCHAHNSVGVTTVS